ncbi:MAG: nucleoside-triphosphatase [Deltaproteobacteria bacterium]
MNKRFEVNEKWLKASVLGSIWAISEIVLGSFLHNLRIPFNGNILTAIGLILMISAAYKWRETGIFWRAGLICALMKTMSPSAVIFGPMVAIFMESLLFELSVRFLGFNFIGFSAGSVFAMIWILVQKIFNFILFYGFNIVDIYTQLMRFAQKQLSINLDLVWIPVVILLFLYIIFGLFAAIMGMRIGRNQCITDNEEFSQNQKIIYNFIKPKTLNFPYSLGWLAYNFFIVLIMMLYINISDSYIWVLLTIIIVVIWAIRYKRVLKQLAKPKFWFFFVIITMITAFTVTYIQGGNNSWVQGFEIGIKMNFRAAIVIIGFSVIGTELYSPRIRDFFSKTFLRQVPVSLELAFESLPQLIKELPDIRIILSKPGLVINTMFDMAEEKIKEIKKQTDVKVFLVTGAIDSGKTTFIKKLVHELQNNGIKTAGIISEKKYFESQRVGYDLVNIDTGEKIVFLEMKKDISGPDHILVKNHYKCESIHKSEFIISEDAVHKGKEWLKLSNASDCKLLIIDEIGKWELNGQIWAESLTEILNDLRKNLLLVVRNTNVNDVINKWQLRNYTIIDIKTVSVKDFADNLAGLDR